MHQMRAEKHKLGRMQQGHMKGLIVTEVDYGAKLDRFNCCSVLLSGSSGPHSSLENFTTQQIINAGNNTLLYSKIHINLSPKKKIVNLLPMSPEVKDSHV